MTYIHVADGKLKVYCPNDNVLVLNKIIYNSILFECQEAKFCRTKKYDCIYNDGRFSCVGEHTFTSSIYQRASDDLILHKCCTFWHQTKDMQSKLKYNAENMKCFNYELNFNKDAEILELNIDNLNNNTNNLDPLKIKKYFTNFDEINHNKEIIFVKKIQPKRQGYYLTLCKNECVINDFIDKNQTSLNKVLSPSTKLSHYNINNKKILLETLTNQRNVNFSRNFNIRMKLRNEKKKKYSLLKTISKDIKTNELEEVSQNINMETFKKMINDFEKHLEHINNTNKNIKIKNKISVFKVNSTEISLPPLSDEDRSFNDNSNILSHLFEKAHRMENRNNKLNITKNINSPYKNISKVPRIISLSRTTPSNGNFFYFQTRQNGLKIKILPENSNEAFKVTTSTVSTTQKLQQKNEETLTVENLPLNLLMKIVQEHNKKENDDTITTTTPEPDNKKLKDEVLNLQKQLLLALLKEKEENKSNESFLNLMSKETLIKLLLNNEQKITTTTTPEPTTKQRIVLEIPKEVLQLLIDTNKSTRQENTKKEISSKEKEKNDEKISLSAVTLLKLLTTNLKNESKEKKDKNDEEDEITTKRTSTISATSSKKMYKEITIIKSEKDESSDDSYEEYTEEIETTTKKLNSRRAKPKVTTKRAIPQEYEESIEKEVEKTKISTTMRSKIKKKSIQTTKKRRHNEDSNDYDDSNEITIKTKTTRKSNKTAASATLLTSSASEESTTFTTKSVRKSKHRPRHSSISNSKRNKKRVNRPKGLLESISSNQFLINLIPRIKETFGIEPQVHPIQRKVNIIPSYANRTLDK